MCCSLGALCWVVSLRFCLGVSFVVVCVFVMLVDLFCCLCYGFWGGFTVLVDYLLLSLVYVVCC